MPKNFQKLKQTIIKMAITTTIIGVTIIGANAETLGNVSGRVNFRKKPSIKSEVITKINKNSKVIILGEEGNWYNIKYNGDTGYASKKYIKETPYSVKSYSATLVAKQRVNVRKGPSIQYTSIGKLKTGEKVKVTGKVSNGWYEVTYNNQKGYMTGSSKYVREYNMEFTVKEFYCTAVVKQNVNVREQPSTQYPSMGKLKAGDKIKVTGKVSNGWYEVIYNGEIGYITGLNKYLSIPNDAPVIETKNDVYEIIQNKNKKSEEELKQIIEATATDKENGNLTDKITFTDLDKVDTTTPKDYTVTLTVKDEDGKATTKTITIKVKKAVNLEIKKDKITLNQNKSYLSTYFKDEKVATATDGEGKDITDKIEYSGSIIDKDGKIDSSKTGTFDVNVSVKGSNDVEETKTIKVEVLAGPTITANDINIEQGTLKSQIPRLINATATDRNGQSITPTYEGIDDINTSNVGGTYTVTVKVIDLEGGITTKDITVTIVYNSPVIIVNNPPTIKTEKDVYEIIQDKTKKSEDELKQIIKATAEDKEDGDLTSKITFTDLDKVDTTTPKDYKVTLTVKDKQGKTATTEITITVKKAVNLTINKETINLNQNKTYPSTYFKDEKVATATDGEGKDTTDQINYTGGIFDQDGKIDTSKAGTFNVNVSVEGSNRVVETKIIEVEVLAGPTITANDIDVIEGTDKSEIPDLINATAVDRNGKAVDSKSITYDVGNVDTTKVGAYKVKIIATDSEGGKTTKEITVTIIENHAPKIEFNSGEMETLIIELQKNHSFSKEDLLKNITVTDEEDGTIKEYGTTDEEPITFNVTFNGNDGTHTENLGIDNIDYSKLGRYIIQVTAKDSQGKTSDAYVLVQIVDKD